MAQGGGAEADVAAVAAAILKCKDSLKCVSFMETKISASIVDALAACSNLHGLLFKYVENCARPGAAGGGHQPTTSEGLAAVLRANPQLKWLHVDGYFGGPSFFGAPCWEALQQGACPGLEVLWVDMCNREVAREWTGQTHAPPAVVREALTAPASALAKSLKLCMINPDVKLVSRFDLDAARRAAAGAKLTAAQKKKADRLQGDKVVEVDYDFPW
jgi:hypothetical protein